MELFFILTGAMIVNNYVLAQFLGLCPFFGVSKKTETAVGMGISVLFVMTFASAITYLINVHVLVRFEIEYLRTIVFILVIASLVQFIEMFMKKNLTWLYSLLGVYLPLITTNCAIFGVVLINVKNNFTFVETIVNAIGAGAGFTIAIILLSVIREKYEDNPDIPTVFKGFPLALFSAGFMSLAFMGFQGLI